MIRTPELVAPAGDWDCVKAAVENGADAIYFGLERHNARMRAANFALPELPKLMAFLHRRGVKGFVTFNTLVFDNEMAEAAQWLRAIIAAGVDAAIVQDVGICRVIRRLSPDFPIHASTQMTITSAGGAKFARELGCHLVVLARECSIQEIGQIQTALAASPAAPGASPLSLEVFIHGALCVAYSGQCLTSESLGGRSANRGVCAQACRMPFDLIADGQIVPLGDRRYLLSPRDLAGLEVLPDLVRAGVASLKIEGRLKSPEYVANITHIYRRALDKLTEDRRHPLPAGLVTPSDLYDMEMAFSRGLHTGWLRGVNNKELVHARFGKKRGVFLGEVARVQGQAVCLKLIGPLKPGDGVVFDAGRPDEEEQGGRVYEIRNPTRCDGAAARRGSEIRSQKSARRTPHAALPDSREVLLTFGRGDVDFRRIHPGDKVWKTSDPELERRLRQSFAGDQPRFQRPITFEVRGQAGQPLQLMARDGSGHEAEVFSAVPLAQADKRPLTLELLREQLGRLGGTPFRLVGLKNGLQGQVILPVSQLNRLRREVVSRLETMRAQPCKWTLTQTDGPVSGIFASSALAFKYDRGAAWQSGDQNGARTFLSAAISERAATPKPSPTFCPLHLAADRNVRAPSPSEKSSREGTNLRPGPEKEGDPAGQLIVLVRSLEQLNAALQGGVRTIYCEFDDPRKNHEAVQMVRSARATGGGPSSAGSAQRNPLEACCSAEIFVAPPRIFKPGEAGILRQIRSCAADGYLVRNYDHLDYFADCRRIGDYSLNVANALSAEYFLRRFQLERVTASYDLNADQLEALLRAAPPDWFEVTIHQYMPMFHMEHCLFCSFLSSGTDSTNCGHPCEHHDVKLRDRVGAEHGVKADAGCRNTVFNALAQTGAESVSRLQALGVRHFRLEFLDEPPDQARQIIARYQQLLRGQISGAQLWRELKLLNQLGVTRGQMDKAERKRGQNLHSPCP